MMVAHDIVRQPMGRRGILGALTAASVLVATPTATASPVLNTASRMSWDHAVQAREAARLAGDDYHRRVYAPLHAEAERIAPRPDLWFEVTAKDGRTARFDVWPSNLHEWDDHLSPVFRQKAAAVRDAWLTHIATRERLGVDAASEESDRLTDAQCACENRLITMPAPDLAAFRWKLEHLWGTGAGREHDDGGDAYCAEWINAIMADARRLLAPA